MNTQEFVELLRRAQGEETQKEFAERMGISPQYLNDVLLGKREPGEGVLKPMGIIKKVSYEKEEPYHTEHGDDGLAERGGKLGQRELDKISQGINGLRAPANAPLPGGGSALSREVAPRKKATYADMDKGKTKLRTPDVNEPSGKPELTLEKDEYAQE